MRKLSAFACLSFSLTLASSVFGQTTGYRFPKPRFVTVPTGQVGTTIDMRCSEDQLFSNEDALRRINWADSCRLVKKSRIFTEQYDEENDAWVARTQYLYPMFSYDRVADNFPLWRPNYANCDLPADVIHLSNCETGCYTGDQLVSFAEGDLPIGDVINGDFSVTKVTTLTKDATLDSLSIQQQPIASFTRSVKDAKENLLTLKTQSGGSLTVTEGHPLVNGEGFVLEADKFNVGDSLVKFDGTLDPIVALEWDREFFGKVYNISPKSNNDQENIVIAQGFLNGSQKYHRKNFGEMSRLLLRSSVPADLN